MVHSRKDDWPALDQRCVWHPYTQMQTAPDPIPVSHAEGVYLHTTDGRKILDGISSWWVNIHGHSHPRLNQVLADQAGKFSQIIFAGFTHEPAARLADELVHRSPESLTRVFFSDNGSTAVEVALKMVYQYWQNRGESDRKRFVALDYAYHGDTFGAMAAGGVRVFHQAFEDLFFEVQRVHTPYCLHCPLDLERKSCQVKCSEAIWDLLERDHQSIAGVIIEPMVQAAGGMIIWPPEFLVQMREATRRYGIPLIADEVFTGFGRTGRFFASEHGPIQPDVMCLSKALTAGYLPLSATLASEELYRSFLSSDRSRTFFHGHSFTGNALACRVGLESLRLFEDENCLARILDLEKLFAVRLEELAKLPVVRQVRGLGAIAVLELETVEGGGGYLDPQGQDLNGTFLEQGILLRPLGNVLYFLPPYVITDEEVHWVFDTVGSVLGRLS